MTQLANTNNLQEFQFNVPLDQIGTYISVDVASGTLLDLYICPTVGEKCMDSSSAIVS